MTSARERFDVLDGLRGCAVLLVVCYHVWLVSGQTAGPFTVIAQAGFLGVDLFFFISGFCLYAPHARAALSGKPAPDIAHFFERRALKIVPSYCIALLAFAIVYRAQFASPQDAFWQLLAHLTFVHPLDPTTFGSISGPLWTIGIEVQFYLLFPLIVIGFSRSPWIGYALLALTAEGYRITIGALGLDTSFWWINQLPAVLDLFAAGMLGAHVLSRLRAGALRIAPENATVISFSAWLCALIGLGIVGGTSGAADDGHAWFNAHRVLIGPLCLILTISTVAAIPAWQAVVAARALTFFSTISYNLYLWHLEVMVWVHNLMGSAIWTVVISLPCAIALAIVFTYAVERPLLRTTIGGMREALRARMPSAWLIGQESVLDQQRG